MNNSKLKSVCFQWSSYVSPNDDCYHYFTNGKAEAGTYYRAEDVDILLAEHHQFLMQLALSLSIPVKDLAERGVDEIEKLRADRDLHYNRCASLLFSGALDNVTGTQAQEWAKEYEDVKAENERLRDALEAMLDGVVNNSNGLAINDPQCDLARAALRQEASNE